MLSILIPTYNFHPQSLLDSLLKQLPADAEIIVGDDCSPNVELASWLRQYCQEKGIRYVRPVHNLGSAGMRNMLCREACGEQLLYIDCDTIVHDEAFISKYAELAGNHIVCGTITHPETMPSAAQSLRWKYEKSMEKRFTADLCNQHPYEHFRTSHFLIPKSIMSEVPFDEGIKGSGYEDLLFGKHLQEKDIKVLHTPICAMNGDIEDNDTFLQKTERQLRTLYQYRAELAEFSTLLHFRDRMKQKHLLGPAILLFKMTRKALRHHLLGKNPNIKLFQFYKLGVYETLAKH